MAITLKQIADLQAALLGAGSAVVAESAAARERYHVGAVWYGNWLSDADRGRFGSPEKPRHNAAVTRRSYQDAFFTLAPITSKDSEAQVTRGVAVFLPRGMIPHGEFTDSYVLARLRLRASRDTLDTKFTYRVNLPADYVQKMAVAAREEGDSV